MGSREHCRARAKLQPARHRRHPHRLRDPLGVRMRRWIAHGITGFLLLLAAGCATAAVISSATTQNAVDITATSATLRGNLAAGTRRAEVVFDYGTSADD